MRECTGGGGLAGSEVWYVVENVMRRFHQALPMLIKKLTNLVLSTLCNSM